MTQNTRLSKKALSLLLACVIVISAFAELTLTVFAAPELPSANTQERGTVCTSLSEDAIVYYTGDYAYDILSSLSGYDDEDSSVTVTQNSELYTALQTLMTDTQTYRPSYSNTNAGTLAYYWQRTDAQYGSENMCCFYTDLRYTNYGSSGYFLPYDGSIQNKSDMQREHIWPKSQGTFNETNAGSDLHHLRPSIGSVNNSKGNNTFGEIHDTEGVEVRYAYESNPETIWWVCNGLFEPKDSVKGDCARILLYVYCRWGETNLYSDNASYRKVIESRDTLLKWCQEDPVDTWEMERNDLVEDVEGNRNVFIDYPEFAWLMFGLRVPEGMQTPSGSVSGGGDGHEHVWSAWTHNEGSNPSTHSRTCSGTVGTCPSGGIQTSSCTFNGGVVTAEPTCVEPGVKTYTCTICGYAYTQPIPATGIHKDEDGDGMCDDCGIDVSALVTDELTRALTEVSGTTYASWEGKKSNSDAVYAGQSAGGNDSIQLRSNNNNSGVVTTASGGKVRTVKVEWNGNTSNGRTLNIYGKNSAYSSPTDLYDTNKQGTLLGTIVCGTSTELTISGDYTFIGFRSAGSAMYLSKVYIVWDLGTGSGGEHEHIWGPWTHDENSDPSTHTRTCSGTVGTCPVNGVQTDPCTFDDGEVTTAATCIADGVKTYTCTTCGYSYTEPIAATGIHSDNDGDGKCDDCGANMIVSVTDTLDNAKTGVTGSTYSAWSGVTDQSQAVYAGNSAGSYSSIQLRTNGSTSGIVSTASGGKVRKVKVEWNANTADGRVLNIYGSNIAYSSPSELYGTDKGTVIGTLVYGSTVTELEISDDYAFVGFRSNANALYLDKIYITWEPDTCTHEYAWDGHVGTDGHHTEVCGNCNETRSVNCTYDDGVYTAATYTTSGYTTYTCTVCGYQNIVEDPNAPAAGTVKEYKPVTALNDGDHIVIYNPNSKRIMTSSITGQYYLSGQNAILNGDTVVNPGANAVWTVVKNADGTYSFKQENVTLYGYTNNSFVNLAVTAGESYVDKWTIDEVDAEAKLFSVKCEGLTYTKDATTYNNVYLSYSSGHFALNGNDSVLASTDKAYMMQFFVLDLEPEVIGESLTARGDIDVSVYLDLPAGLVEGNDDLVVKLYDGETLLESIPVASSITDNGYRFMLSKPAKNIRDVVTLKLYDGDQLVQLSNNGTLADSIDYSVQGYLDSVIANESSYPAELVALCKAMSDYGSYAMIQQGYHANDVTAFYGAAEIATITVDTIDLRGLLTDLVIPETSSIEGLEFYGASLVMLNEMVLRLYYTYTGSDELTSGGHVLQEKDGLRYVDVPCIAAKDFDVGQSVMVTDGTSTYTVSGYSVHTYVRKVLIKYGDRTEPEDVNLVNLVKAIANYGLKAKAYFG